MMDRRANDLHDSRWEAADILATLYTIGYLGMVGLVMYITIPTDNAQIVNTLVTIMSTIQIGIGKFYYDGTKADKQAQKAAVVQQARASSAIQDIAKAAAPTQAAAVAAATSAAVTPPGDQP